MKFILDLGHGQITAKVVVWVRRAGQAAGVDRAMLGELCRQRVVASTALRDC